LFEVIGTSFGSDGEGTFKIPDMRGRTACAIGQGVGLTNRTIGAYVGAETHTLSVDEIPSHAHTITDNGHTHSYVNNTNDQGTDNAFGTETAADQVDVASTTGNSTTGITINSTGGGQAHNNMQPSAFIGNVFIYTGKFPISLSPLRAWARLAQSAYADLKDSFMYRYDAGDINSIQWYISDGGNDMYDGGNYVGILGNVFTGLELQNNSESEDGALRYGAEYVRNDETCGFYVSDPNSYPHLTFTFTRGSGILGIRSYGNEGSDGDAAVMNVSGQYQCANGCYGNFWANINYNAEDPTIGDVWFTISNDKWDVQSSSSYDLESLDDQRKLIDDNDYDQYVSIQGTNFAFCKVLLSKRDGILITETEVQDFLTNYIQAMPLANVFPITNYEEE
jgi:microcystin-dependent protein